MTAIPKVKIKTDEQVRTKKRKRPETERAKNNKEKLKELKDGLSEIKNKGIYRQWLVLVLQWWVLLMYVDK